MTKSTQKGGNTNIWQAKNKKVRALEVKMFQLQFTNIQILTGAYMVHDSNHVKYVS